MLSDWQPFDRVRITQGTLLGYTGHVMPVVDYMRITGNFTPMPEDWVPVVISIVGREVPLVFGTEQLELLPPDDDL